MLFIFRFYSTSWMENRSLVILSLTQKSPVFQVAVPFCLPIYVEENAMSKNVFNAARITEAIKVFFWFLARKEQWWNQRSQCTTCHSVQETTQRQENSRTVKKVLEIVDTLIWMKLNERLFKPLRSVFSYWLVRRNTIKLAQVIFTVGGYAWLVALNLSLLRC